MGRFRDALGCSEEGSGDVWGLGCIVGMHGAVPKGFRMRGAVPSSGDAWARKCASCCWDIARAWFAELLATLWIVVQAGSVIFLRHGPRERPIALGLKPSRVKAQIDKASSSRA